MEIKISTKMLISLIFIFLMIGSTFAFALLNAFRSPEEEIKIPNQRIIDYELDDRQRTSLLKRYYTLMEYRYFTGCLECGSVKSKLESVTQNSENQIFLQEIVSENNVTSSLTITSLKGGKTLINPSGEDIENLICDFLVNQPLWCITSKI
jgi:hypothetical protein